MQIFQEAAVLHFYAPSCVAGKVAIVCARIHMHGPCAAVHFIDIVGITGGRVHVDSAVLLWHRAKRKDKRVICPLLEYTPIPSCCLWCLRMQCL